MRCCCSPDSSQRIRDHHGDLHRDICRWCHAHNTHWLFQSAREDCAHKEVLSRPASFDPLLCCGEGTSYATQIINGRRTQCFKGSGTTCAGTNNNWGFYVAPVMPGNSIKLISGGGNDCTKGTEVGTAEPGVQCKQCRCFATQPQHHRQQLGGFRTPRTSTTM